VTDFNGTVLPEKDLAARDGIRYTPTIQFFPESADRLGDLPPREREVARVMGYPEPDAFRRSFAYVREREEESLQQCLVGPREAGTGRRARPARPRHLFTGLSGSISRATMSRICSGVSTSLVPNRGIIEHGSAACGL
jgi:hypothetical protein